MSARSRARPWWGPRKLPPLGVFAPAYAMGDLLPMFQSLGVEGPVRYGSTDFPVRLKLPEIRDIEARDYQAPALSSAELEHVQAAYHAAAKLEAVAVFGVPIEFGTRVPNSDPEGGAA